MLYLIYPEMNLGVFGFKFRSRLDSRKDLRDPYLDKCSGKTNNRLKTRYVRGKRETDSHPPVRVEDLRRA